MYRYKGWNQETGNGMNKSGTLVECLKLARRNYSRLGMIGEIFRPDGSNLREPAPRIELP